MGRNRFRTEIFTAIECTIVGEINLDNLLKNRDIILPTNVHLVKAMVFPVVMYRCEIWSINKVEHQRIDVFEP